MRSRRGDRRLEDKSKVEQGNRNRGKVKLKSRPLIRVCAPEKLLDLVPFNYIILHLYLRARN